MFNELKGRPRRWLVTGAAGFIGSNLVETLLRLEQPVAGLDNFSTGKHPNLEEIRQSVSARQWERFHFIKGDIRRLETCQQACQGVEFVLHQAALGSVPRSLEDPLHTNESNVTGFLNMLVAAREAKVKRFVYASSSSIYGDHPGLPKVEEVIGRPLSPYAVTKQVNELYADVFGRCYQMETIGLRYFNVFGPRQDPEGAYAAVIPRWIAAMIENRPATIHGDGSATRDFCYVANAIQANLLAATAQNREAVGQVYNIALNSRTSLNELFQMLRHKLTPACPHLENYEPVHGPERPGDVRDSQADIEKAWRLLGYRPSHTVEQGIDAALEWYLEQFKVRSSMKGVSHGGAF
jgi:UDP-N-acetylglucosamine/UDP-N-acetylgalactosamine 4-epimerase